MQEQSKDCANDLRQYYDTTGKAYSIYRLTHTSGRNFVTTQTGMINIIVTQKPESESDISRDSIRTEDSEKLQRPF